MARKVDVGGVPFSRRHPVIHTALQYGGIGAGVAATAALVRELKDAMDEKEKEKNREKVEISPGTIVLRVPKSKLHRADKYAEDLHAVSGDHESVSRVESSSDTAVDVMKNKASKAGVQRDVAGRFVSGSDVRVNPPVKKAEETGVGTRAAEILAAIGAFGGGYYAIDRLRQKLQQNRLKKQIAAAQQEYVDLLDGSSVKGAEAVNSMLALSDGQEKTAGLRDLWNNGKNMSAAGLATLIAMTLGSGYVTKRILENKFDEPEEEEEPRKINRIMFKTYDDEKSASADEFEVTHEQVLASLGIMMSDMLATAEKEAADYSFLDKITKSDEGRQWLLDAYAKNKGLSRPDFDMNALPGMSGKDKLVYSRTLLGIKRNPGRHMPAIEKRVMAIMRDDPKGWFAMIGRGRNSDLVKRVAGETFEQYMRGGGLGMLGTLPGLDKVVKPLGLSWLTGTKKGRGVMESAFNNMIGAGQQSKSASVLDMYGKINEATANAKINRDKTNEELSRKLDDILDRMDKTGGRKRRGRTREQAPEGVDVSSDPEAEGYVVENGREIAKALNALQRKGLV